MSREQTFIARYTEEETQQTFVPMYTEEETQRPLPLPGEPCAEAFRDQRYSAVEADAMSPEASVNHFPTVHVSKYNLQNGLPEIRRGGGLSLLSLAAQRLTM